MNFTVLEESIILQENAIPKEETVTTKCHDNVWF